MLGVTPPPKIAFERTELSAFARGFYAEAKRVGHDRIELDLGVALACPTARV